MSLILIREINGKGNCDADGKYVPPSKVPMPDGTTAIKRNTGTHLRLDTAKAEGIVFSSWQIVPCKNDRQEAAILRHCAKQWGGGNSPIVRFDWRDKELVAAWRENNASASAVVAIDDAVKSGDVGFVTEVVASLMAATSNGPTRAPKEVPQIQDINAAPKVERSYSAETPQARAAQRARGVADAEEMSTRHQDHASAIYQQKYEEHVANGVSQKQAAEWAERSRKAALKKDAPEPAPQQAAG